MSSKKPRCIRPIETSVFHSEEKYPATRLATKVCTVSLVTNTTPKTMTNPKNPKRKIRNFFRSFFTKDFFMFVILFAIQGVKVRRILL